MDSSLSLLIAKKNSIIHNMISCERFVNGVVKPMRLKLAHYGLFDIDTVF